MAARVAEGEWPLERAGVGRGVAAEHGVEERVAGDLGAQVRQVLRRLAQCWRDGGYWGSCGQPAAHESL